jgi:hypothetical protein
MSFGRSQAQHMIAAAAAAVARGPDVSSLTDDINAKAAFKYNPLLEEQVSVPSIRHASSSIAIAYAFIFGCVIHAGIAMGVRRAGCHVGPEPNLHQLHQGWRVALQVRVFPLFLKVTLVGSPRTPFVGSSTS